MIYAGLLRLFCYVNLDQASHLKLTNSRIRYFLNQRVGHYERFGDWRHVVEVVGA